MRRNDSINKFAFLMGLCSAFQIWWSLSITEAIALVMFPCILLDEYRYMKRNGITTYFWLAVLVVIGCAISCWVNHCSFQQSLRGLATTGIFVCAIVVGHWMLRKNLNCYKWFLVGTALSCILNIFIFQNAAEVTGATGMAGGPGGMAVAEEIINNEYLFLTRFGPLSALPTKAFYLHTPMWWDVIIIGIVGLLPILNSVSGRSAALGTLGFIGLLLLGGKSMRTMKRVTKHFITLLCLGIVFVFAAKAFYSYAAKSGLMGDESLKKYEDQTEGGEDILSLLMGGRMEVFCGLFACLDHPIVGFGPWAVDNDGYIDDYMAKYGTDEDLRIMAATEKYRAGKARLIPGHSHIIGFWLWYGIFGLILWLYILYILFRFLRQDCYAIPQWYAWLACAIPGFLWDIFFSPFGDRFSRPMFFVAILLARAVRLGKQPLPYEMIREIEENERKRR
jgi:hypothetical protein